ncbi:hypothetical protein L226DRAFT_569539 [Lentinus tigrinus ALCF2SS1-7]|uniref:Uncharacterized protein n=1 Tax=Lentinus tigrinus ALCF2SS1-6 TaxID=1328759 RepID=A0A5C2SRN9_9APHY|nr:hypothetical protein L227DRAFT_607762 [Lentinus tigrinus ALCF2SS1-6]RPD76248.1 hypothetical protein L226DRAFT_569539 [Lentinus tigrinus ALCF2SS1-7]
MLDEPVKMRTRARLKSCLKISPPITPDLSAASSPCHSGRTSPSMASDSGSAGSCCRKTVSFCSDDSLEEVFFADEWDRTPAAVTPKLTYQDVLELKQLRINLPYTPPPPPPSSSKPPYPLSRFASTASHTPSKWKNRSEPQRPGVDPEILPYLDAVPIRLLPLLPQSPTEPSPPSSAPPEPHPQTPTPTASPETRPTIQSRDPPELRMEPVISPSVSPPSVPSSPLQLRKQGFSFLPLLPVQDPPPLPPPLTSTAPTPPRRKFNMTFLPVNAVSEAEPSVSTPDVSASKRTDVDGEVGTSTSAPLPSPSSSVSRADQSPGAGHLTSIHRQTHLMPSSPSTSGSSDTSSPLPMTPPPPSSFSLPILPAFQQSIESDTETETDTYTDTDAESDAPSTSSMGSSLPSSPPCDDDDGQSDIVNLKLDTELVPPGYYPRIHTGSYFPPILANDTSMPVPIPAHVLGADASPTQSSRPGQTPPLSVLFPSPQLQAQALLPLDALATSEPVAPSKESEALVVPVPLERDGVQPLQPPSGLASTPTDNSSLPATPLSMSRKLHQKLMLEALPSPALGPPSPFELEPLRTTESSRTSDAVVVNAPEGASENVIRTLDRLRGSTGDKTPVFSASVSPDDSPLLTLESMRVSWDARARARLASTGQSGGVLIAPSLSRRRLSS